LRQQKGGSMRKWMVALAVVTLPAYASPSAELSDKVWNHGSEDCSSNKDPAIEVFQFDAATYVLRQNKCVHFEAPFIYVLFGEHTVFVQDTGAFAALSAEIGCDLSGAARSAIAALQRSSVLDRVRVLENT
jgi:hypothetical protein